MYFNSVEFFVFFPIVYGLFWASRNNQRLRNWILLLASYLFYGWWDWRFLSLIWISTCVDFVCARKISESGARFWLLLSIATNLGFLATFKYLDFFVGSFSALATSLGFELSAPTLGIVLPVGISFYTFQTMGYTIDVYRKRQRATDDLLTFAVYVAYFPQLVAGPIERASRLLPALSKRPVFSLSNIQSGLWLAYFGLFKKVAVADATAPIVESVFSKGGDVTGPEALLGVYAFALQIYCDFSGYSDIARGISRMMGIELALNFRRPYFSVSPSDFWQRWHISLSSWLRDYLYIPLGGSRASVSKTYRNLALTMLIGGLWHGPTWMFVLWGAWHGMVLIIYRVLESDVRRIRFADLRGVRRFLAGLFFFHLVCIGWLFFRAESVEQVTGFLSAMGSGFEWSDPVIARFIQLGALALLLLFIDTVQEIWEENGSETPVITRWPVLARGVILFLMGLQLAVFGVDGAQTFIYFQF